LGGKWRGKKSEKRGNNNALKRKFWYPTHGERKFSAKKLVNKGVKKGKSEKKEKGGRVKREGGPANKEEKGDSRNASTRK